LLEVILALLSLLGLVAVDFWLSDVTLEAGTEAGLAVLMEAREAMVDRGLTVLVLVEGRIVAELTEEASARGFAPPVSANLEVELASGLVAATLGLPDLGRGAVMGLAVLGAGVEATLEDSLDGTARAGGTGGLVLILGARVITGVDLGLEPRRQLENLARDCIS
jgi:hypothetical protein